MAFVLAFVFGFYRLMDLGWFVFSWAPEIDELVNVSMFSGFRVHGLSNDRHVVILMKKSKILRMAPFLALNFSMLMN